MGSWPDSGDHLVLVGMMGTGKSTVGRLLAERAGCALVDSDDQVEARAGRTVREIFEQEGEPAFRRWESEAIVAALGSTGPTVIAAAGGVVLDPANRALLCAHPIVVWLRATPALLAGRVVTADHRPLLGQDPLSSLTRLLAAREPLYLEVARHAVKVDDLAPAAVAARVWELVA